MWEVAHLCCALTHFVVWTSVGCGLRPSRFANAISQSLRHLDATQTRPVRSASLSRIRSPTAAEPFSCVTATSHDALLLVLCCFAFCLSVCSVFLFPIFHLPITVPLLTTLALSLVCLLLDLFTPKFLTPSIAFDSCPIPLPYPLSYPEALNTHILSVPFFLPTTNLLLRRPGNPQGTFSAPAGFPL